MYRLGSSEDRSALPVLYSGRPKEGNRAIRIWGLAAAQRCSHGLREGSMRLERAFVAGSRSQNLVTMLTSRERWTLMLWRSQEGGDAGS